jgi:hypothetical protein
MSTFQRGPGGEETPMTRRSLAAIALFLAFDEFNHSATLGNWRQQRDLSSIMLETVLRLRVDVTPVWADRRFLKSDHMSVGSTGPAFRRTMGP